MNIEYKYKWRILFVFLLISKYFCTYQSSE